MHRKNPNLPTLSAPESPLNQRPNSPPPQSQTLRSINPIEQPSKPTSYLSSLNPLNLIPRNLSNAPAPQQPEVLPLERETSTIPRGDGSGTKWEYPSPQQMYNAMLRKGHTDTPIDAVESMVAWHNYLNEGAWAEILEWERRFGRGLLQGWRESWRGEQGSVHGAADYSIQWGTGTLSGSSSNEVSVPPEPELVSLTGKPGELTPRARMIQALGTVFPSYYARDPPFDRHDWVVKRTKSDGSAYEVRYVIDYYEAPPEPNGDPAFFLDVRPAIDTPEAAMARMVRWGRDVWYRGTGAEVRAAKKETSS
jgi:cytochrome c heme-lyase